MITLRGKISVQRLRGIVNIAASEGGGGPLQAKTVYPSHEEQIVAPDEEYYGLVAVTVRPVPRKPAVESMILEGTAHLDTPVSVEKNLGITVSVSGEIYVTFTSACSQNTGGTSLTGTVDVTSGDWILATVTTRSATTLPSDWTVLRESTVLTDEGLKQRMFFLCKQATEDGTESITIEQEESARIYLNLIVAHGATGFAYHEGTEAYYDAGTATSITLTRPNKKLLVWGCTSPYWSSSSPYGTWSCDDLSAICLDQSTTQPRQANFIDRDSTVSSRTFANGLESDVYYIIDCVEVLY